MKLISLIITCLSLAVTISAQNITSAEYFIDQDAGIGNNTSLDAEITSAASMVEIPFTADLTELKPGLHRLYCRVADENNSWSLASVQTFQVISGAAAGNIVAGEYFIDEDPGFGSGKSIIISAAATTQNLVVTVNLASANEGLHTLYVRVKDEPGNWSLAAQQPFFVINSSEMVKITQLEYYFSGGSENTSTYIYDDFEPAEVVQFSAPDFMADASKLEYDEVYTLHVRALNSNGNYSAYNTVTFTFKELNSDNPDQISPIKENALSFYPNPTKHMLFLHGKLTDGNLMADYAIFDIGGNLVMNGKLSSTEIDISGLKKGNYYLVISHQSEIYRGNITKQ